MIRAPALQAEEVVVLFESANSSRVFNEEQLSVMRAALDQVCVTMCDHGIQVDVSDDKCRSRIASIIIEIATGADCDVPTLTRLVLDRMIPSSA